eukprot:4339704-Pyramimonas_sp.AAC.1
MKVNFNQPLGPDMKIKVNMLISKSKKPDRSDFTAEVPMSFINFEATAIPGVWPLQGAVARTKEFFMQTTDNGEAPPFPPPGVIMEMAMYRAPLEESDM